MVIRQQLKHLMVRSHIQAKVRHQKRRHLQFTSKWRKRLSSYEPTQRVRRLTWTLKICMLDIWPRRASRSSSLQEGKSWCTTDPWPHGSTQSFGPNPFSLCFILFHLELFCSIYDLCFIGCFNRDINMFGWSTLDLRFILFSNIKHCKALGFIRLQLMKENFECLLLSFPFCSLSPIFFHRPLPARRWSPILHRIAY